VPTARVDRVTERVMRSVTLANSLRARAIPPTGVAPRVASPTTRSRRRAKPMTPRRTPIARVALALGRAFVEWIARAERVIIRVECFIARAERVIVPVECFIARVKRAIVPVKRSIGSIESMVGWVDRFGPTLQGVEARLHPFVSDDRPLDRSPRVVDRADHAVDPTDQAIDWMDRVVETPDRTIHPLR
jgi:hypothetical protein